MREPDKRNPFHVMKDQSREAVRDELERNWEHARVRYAMNRLGLGPLRSKLMGQARRETGDTFLTFDRFGEAFPTFPIAIGCDRLSVHRIRKRKKGGGYEVVTVEAEPLHRDANAFHPVWFKNFMQVPFVPHFEAFFESAGDLSKIKPVGMVFPRKGFPQGLIVHNGDIHDFVSPKSGCHVYLGGGKKPMTLVVQPFQGLLDHIHKVRHWKPDDPG